MIKNFSMNKVDAKIDEMNLLVNKRFQKLNISIDNVEDKEDNVLVSYTFLADYKDGDSDNAEKIGHIKMSGVIEISEENDEKGKLLEQWKDKGNLPIDIAEEVINGINFRCSATGTLIAYSLGLIPPLVISQTKVSEPNKQNEENNK